MKSSLLGLALLFSISGFAQEKLAQQKPAPEPAPRWPDGRVNLGSVPGKKGYWEVRPGLGGTPRPDSVPFQPWAKAVYEHRSSTYSRDSPLVACKPAPGPSF